MDAKQKLQDLINKHSNDELSLQDGHVTQVWQDGEITSQKSGDLLWQRNIHQMMPPLSKMEVEDVEWKHTHGNNKYIFCTGPAAKEIREALREAMIEQIQNAY